MQIGSRIIVSIQRLSAGNAELIITIHNNKYNDYIKLH